MKRYLKIFLCTFVLTFSIFAMFKINTYAITENKNDFNIMINEIARIEKSEKERIAKEKIEQEKLAKERAEQERLAREKTEQERIEKEKQEHERRAREKASVKNTTAKKSVQSNTSTNVKYGTFGRLYVSNFSVALYDFNVNTKSGDSLQTIVNNKDSAAYYRNHGRLIIADHNYQGFSVLANLNEGTTSYIKFEDGSTIKYTLIKKSRGVNTGPDLKDTDGNSFFDMKSDLIMYTCYEDGIMATLWALS